MSFIAKLQLQNEDEMNVIRCDFRFNQTIDVTGKAASRPMGGTINILLSSTNHASILEWMISTHQKKSGRITFITYDTMNKLKTLEFENALCVVYNETFDPGGKYPITLEITLSAQIIRLEDTVFKNNWPGL